MVTSLELKPGYEQVFTVTDHYDGPRQGVANFQGQPHFYDCMFSETDDRYSKLYRLTPISHHIWELATEDWEIWKRWQSAYHTGRTTLETHPALPPDRARHEEIEAVLASALQTDTDNCIIRTATFEVIGKPNLPKGVSRPLQVKWTEPKPQD